MKPLYSRNADILHKFVLCDYHTAD